MSAQTTDKYQTIASAGDYVSQANFDLTGSSIPATGHNEAANRNELHHPALSLSEAVTCPVDWLKDLSRFESRRAAAFDAWYILGQLPTDELTPEKVYEWLTRFVMVFRNDDETLFETKGEVRTGFAFALVVEAAVHTNLAISSAPGQRVPELRLASESLQKAMEKSSNRNSTAAGHLASAFGNLLDAFLFSRGSQYAHCIDRAWKAALLSLELRGYVPQTILKS